MSELSGYEAKFVWNGVAVGQVRDLRGPALQQDPINVTTRDDGEQDQFVGGMRDGGEVTLDVVYDPALPTQTVLREALAAGAAGMGEMQMTETGTTKPGGLRFFALVTGFEPTAPMRDALAADVSVKLSHAPAGIDYLVTHAGDQLVTETGKFLIA